MSFLVKLSNDADAIWHRLAHDALAPADDTSIVLEAVSYSELSAILHNEEKAANIWQCYRKCFVDNIPIVLWKTFACGDAPSARQKLN